MMSPRPGAVNTVSSGKEETIKPQIARISRKPSTFSAAHNDTRSVAASEGNDNGQTLEAAALSRNAILPTSDDFVRIQQRDIDASLSVIGSSLSHRPSNEWPPLEITQNLAVQSNK